MELTSTVPILVYATWEALSCDETSAVLGSAGAVFINANFPNAPFTDTWYNARWPTSSLGPTSSPGTRRRPIRWINTGADIRARFNVNLGKADCLPGEPFYLGLDNNHGDLVDFYSVRCCTSSATAWASQVLTDASSGRRFGNPALPSVWERFLLDTDSNTTWRST